MANLASKFQITVYRRWLHRRMPFCQWRERLIEWLNAALSGTWGDRWSTKLGPCLIRGFTQGLPNATDPLAMLRLHQNRTQTGQFVAVLIELTGCFGKELDGQFLQVKVKISSSRGIKDPP